MMTLDTEIDATETMIEDRFRRHRHAEIILSMPGFGVVLGAEFLAATGGEMSAFDSVDRLAGVSGWHRYPGFRAHQRQSQTPRRYDRRLLRACYLSAQIAIRTDAASRTYYDRKRSQEKPTPKPCSPWPVDASTSFGQCCATTRPINPPHLKLRRLDNFIENLLKHWWIGKDPARARAGG
ncbi:transposase IS116/IS110/IS902 family protein [Mycobacterium xenopi 3993]|nr:transposase IS116/IS110/IS902 family protein [Mycobacterium xenopi 3993]